MPISAKDHSVVRIERYVDSLVAHDVQAALLALLAASGVLWLIAVENATNLLLARSTVRQREIAMRGALGASRWRVIQQLIVEGVTLSTMPAALGIGLALGSVRLFGYRTEPCASPPGAGDSGRMDCPGSIKTDSELCAVVDDMAGVTGRRSD